MPSDNHITINLAESEFKEATINNRWCLNAEHSLSVSNSGNVSACCMATSCVLDENGEQMNATVHSLEKIHASQYLMSVRENLRNGIKDPMCNRCWEEEDAGKVSKRMRDNKHVKFSTPPVQGDLKVLELFLGNTCNIKCRTCGPYNSSQWVREWFDLVETKAYRPPTWDDYRKQNANYTILYDSDSSFWDSVYNVAPSVEHIDFYGGEPFLIKKQWEFIKHCVETGIAKNKSLHYSTNCTTRPTEYMQYFRDFKWVSMGLSIDGVGEHNHFIRYPAVWDTVNVNVDKWCQYTTTSENTGLHLCMTLSPMNIFYMDQMIEYVEQKNETFGDHTISLYLNLVHSPPHYNIGSMPDYFKKAVTEKMQPYLDRNAGMRSIIKFMNDGIHDPSAWKLFKQWTRDHDEYRGQNFSATFPEVHEILVRNDDAV